MTKRGQATKRAASLANIIIAGLGGLSIHYATNWGVWAFSDSASYFSAARNLIEGRGMIIQEAGGGIVYFQQFPPLYPLVLGAAGWLSGDFFSAARWINILAFSLFLYLTGKLMLELTQHSPVGLAAPLLLLVSPVMVECFSGAMTEPIFFVLMMLSLLLVTRLLKDADALTKTAYIAVSMLLPLTRYAGLALIAANTLILLAFSNQPFWKRISQSFISLVLIALPILLWVAHLYSITGRIGGRHIVINASILDSFCHGISEMIAVLKTYLPYAGLYESLIPSSTRLILFCCALIFLVGGCIWLITKKRAEEQFARAALEKYLSFPIHLLVFLAFIGTSYSLTKRSYVIDQRQLAPLIPMTILLWTYSFHILFQGLTRLRWLSAALLSFVFLLTLRYNFFISRSLIKDLHRDGYGYTSREYQTSGFIDALQEIPQEKRIISNAAGFVLLYNNRMPIQIDQFHQRMYGSGDAYGEAIFREKGAALVIIKPDFNNYYGEGAEELYSALTNGLRCFYEDQAGAIFYYPK